LAGCKIGKKLLSHTHYLSNLWSILPTLYEQLFRQYYFTIKLQIQTVIREKLQKTLSYKKLLVICWWIWYKSKDALEIQNHFQGTPFFVEWFVFSLSWNIMCQFHQRCTRSFFIRKSFFYLPFGFVIFGANFLYKKRARKTLMKLTSCVNFINILGADFMLADPKTLYFWNFWDLRAFTFTVCKMFVKLTPWDMYPI